MENVIDLEILHTALYVCKNKTAHSERRVQKITIIVTKLHIHHQMCKNKIAHITCSVQKIGVFMNFANNTLQMMKEMMFLRDEMTKIDKFTLQIKTKEHFAKTSSFVI